jgi:hypothetical protein
MNKDESFDNLTYADQVHLAERELASFIGAVKELFGPEQALLSADDWLDESELVDCPPRSTSRDWRAVTVAASARLANRGTLARDHRPLRHRLIRRFRQYYRPIVSHPLFCCDASSQRISFSEAY